MKNVKASFKNFNTFKEASLELRGERNKEYFFKNILLRILLCLKEILKYHFSEIDINKFIKKVRHTRSSIWVNYTKQ